MQLPGKTLYAWYRQNLSGYPEAVSSGSRGKDNFRGRDKKEKAVPILKQENFAEEMTIDEKMIDEEFYTVMTNRQTGKIALPAETMRIDELYIKREIRGVRISSHSLYYFSPFNTTRQPTIHVNYLIINKLYTLSCHLQFSSFSGYLMCFPCNFPFRIFVLLPNRHNAK